MIAAMASSPRSTQEYFVTYESDKSQMTVVFDDSDARALVRVRKIHVNLQTITGRWLHGPVFVLSELSSTSKFGCLSENE